MPGPLRTFMTAVSGVPPGRIGRWVLCWSGIALMLCSVLSSGATGEEADVIRRCSLREAMPQVGVDYQTAYSVTVRTAFGPSGRMVNLLTILPEP